MSESPETSPAADQSWPPQLDALRARHPGQKDSVLFCLHKLEQDPGVGLPELRGEAADLGIPMAGRALHSAKVLLGMAEAKPRRAAKPKPAAAKASADVKVRGTDPGIEEQVLSAVRQIQSVAGAEAERMRRAIRQAIEILQDAING